MIKKEEIINAIEKAKNWVLNLQKENGCFHGDFIWHDGEGIRALLSIYRRTKEDILIEKARRCADFILSLQYLDKKSPLYGAYETPAYTSKNQIAPSDIFECLSGIIEIYKETKEERYINSAKLAADWIIKNLYSPGVIGQVFDIKNWQHLNPLPIHDDASFLMLYEETKEEKYLKVFKDQIDYLIKNQDLEGNWYCGHYYFKETKPCSGRTLYWFTYSILMAYKFFKESYLIPSLIRAVDRILRLQLWDGSIPAGIEMDGSWRLGNYEGNDGTATAMCSIILLETYLLFNEKRYYDSCLRCLKFILDNQLPDGQFYHSKLFKDNKWVPFQRDISTFFGIIALENYLKRR